MVDIGELCDEVRWSCTDNLDMRQFESKQPRFAGWRAKCADQFSANEIIQHTHTHTHLAVPEYAAHLFICELTF